MDTLSTFAALGGALVVISILIILALPYIRRIARSFIGPAGWINFVTVAVTIVTVIGVAAAVIWCVVTLFR